MLLLLPMRRGNSLVLAAQALGGVPLGVRAERDWQLAADQVGVEWSSIAKLGMMGKGAKELEQAEQDIT